MCQRNSSLRRASKASRSSECASLVSSPSVILDLPVRVCPLLFCDPSKSKLRRASLTASRESPILALPLRNPYNIATFSSMEQAWKSGSCKLSSSIFRNFCCSSLVILCFAKKGLSFSRTRSSEEVSIGSSRMTARPSSSSSSLLERFCSSSLLVAIALVSTCETCRQSETFLYSFVSFFFYIRLWGLEGTKSQSELQVDVRTRTIFPHHLYTKFSVTRLRNQQTLPITYRRHHPFSPWRCVPLFKRYVPRERERVSARQLCLPSRWIFLVEQKKTGKQCTVDILVGCLFANPPPLPISCSCLFFFVFSLCW